jgi:hypothetical protein
VPVKESFSDDDNNNHGKRYFVTEVCGLDVSLLRNIIYLTGYITVSLRLFCVTGSSAAPTTIPVSHDLASSNFISMHYSSYYVFTHYI